MSFSNNIGVFRLYVGEGDYSVTHEPLQSWNLTTDSVEYNVAISQTTTYSDSLLFGFSPDSLYSKLDVSLVNIPNSCSEETNFWINYRNIGTVNQGGIIELVLDVDYEYLYSFETADSIVGSSIFWSFDSLGYFANENIHFISLTPDFNSMGDTLTSIVNIYTDGPFGTNVFTDTLSEIVTCAYDPNDKLVTPKGEGEYGIINKDQTLEYTIRFQNTGNDTAKNILIRDTIDESLDLSTLTVLSSSHNVEVYLEQNRWLVFRMDSILLPDSSTNFLASQGYVRFCIDVNSNTLPNTQILNTAYIFFDFNPAVITNTTINTVECYILPDAPEIHFFDTILFVNTQYDIQWYLNNTLIDGATDTTFCPFVTGDYSVMVIDDNGCFSFSESYRFISVEIKNNMSLNSWIFPNPATQSFSIDVDSQESTIEIFDTNGKTIKKITTYNGEQIPVADLSRGLYFVKQIAGNNISVGKLVVE